MEGCCLLVHLHSLHPAAEPLSPLHSISFHPAFNTLRSNPEYGGESTDQPPGAAALAAAALSGLESTDGEPDMPAVQRRWGWLQRCRGAE